MNIVNKIFLITVLIITVVFTPKIQALSLNNTLKSIFPNFKDFKKMLIGSEKSWSIC